MRIDAALADEPELWQSTEEWGADLGALANEHECLGLVQSLGERVDVLDVIVPDLDIVPRQLREAVERAQRVVVVVEDGDLHRHQTVSVATDGGAFSTRTFAVTERPRSRTEPASGCHTSPILKNGGRSHRTLC